MEDNILETIKILSGSRHYAAWISRKIKGYLYGSVLDVGSGIGNIAKHFFSLERIKRVFLSEKSDIMLGLLEKSFAHLDACRVVRLDICGYVGERAARLPPMDVITCVNVLEHLDDDKALANMHTLIRRGGTLIIIVPAVPAIYGTLDAFVGHSRRYTKETLSEKLLRADFVIQNQHYFNFFGIITWFLGGRVLRQRRFPEHICALLDKSVPFWEIIEKHYCPRIGQSLLSICTKA